MSVLLDTSILVEIIREREPALRWLSRQRRQPLAAPTIVLMELFAGVATRRDRAAVVRVSEAIELVPLDAAIAERAGTLFRRYHPSHAIGVADSIIAATAQVSKKRLATLNLKHFPMLEDVSQPF